MPRLPTPILPIPSAPAEATDWKIHDKRSTAPSATSSQDRALGRPEPLGPRDLVRPRAVGVEWFERSYKELKQHLSLIRYLLNTSARYKQGNLRVLGTYQFTDQVFANVRAGFEGMKLTMEFPYEFVKMVDQSVMAEYFGGVANQYVEFPETPWAYLLWIRVLLLHEVDCVPVGIADPPFAGAPPVPVMMALLTALPSSPSEQEAFQWLQDAWNGKKGWPEAPGPWVAPLVPSSLVWQAVKRGSDAGIPSTLMEQGAKGCPAAGPDKGAAFLP